MAQVKQSLFEALKGVKADLKKQYREMEKWCKIINTDFVSIYNRTNRDVNVRCRMWDNAIALSAEDGWYEFRAVMTPKLTNNGRYQVTIDTRGFSHNVTGYKFAFDTFEQLYASIDEANGEIGKYLTKISEAHK